MSITKGNISSLTNDIYINNFVNNATITVTNNNTITNLVSNTTI